jgi:hypothetical protein
MIENSTTSITSASITSSLSDFRNYLLAEIECAALRAQLLHNDIVAISVALEGHFIDAESAIEHLADCGALRLVASSSAITWAST